MIVAGGGGMNLVVVLTKKDRNSGMDGIEFASRLEMFPLFSSIVFPTNKSRRVQLGFGVSNVARLGETLW